MPRNSRSLRARGFTLLEMLVVLVIVGLTSAVVLPNLTTVGASLDFALKREGFEQALNALAYQAFRENQDIVLSGVYTDTGRVTASETKKDPGLTIPGSMRTGSLLANQREILPPINPSYPSPQLPPGWRLEVTDPIYIHSSGYCDGGNVELVVGRARYSYALVAPLCHAVLTE